MGDLVSRLSSEGPQLWQQLAPLQKATLAAVALAAVATMAYVSQWAQQPEYVAAFTGLSESDASAVVTRLRESKVPYELTGGGATIRVPADRLYEIRMEMAAQGLPKGGSVGFELFDKTNFGLTDFAQKMNFRRALEGELSRTIGGLSAVEEARVHIALPQEELFTQKQKPVTASIVLRMKPGQELDARHVRGVTNLVSRSVEGLKPENVTILDGDGLLLSGQGDGALGTADSSSALQDVQRVHERALQRDIQEMLEQVLGPRKAVVRVSAAFDWDQYESSSETYSPNGKPAQVRSSREITERSAVPLGDGILSGIPSYPMAAAASGPVSPQATQSEPRTPRTEPESPTGSNGAAASGEPRHERREVVNNYELSKLVERTVKAPGTVHKLSVSVMVDGELGEALAASISKSVSAAAGLDPSRGDAVVVTGLPFDRSLSAAREQVDQEMVQRDLYTGVARGALILLSVLVVLLLVRSMIAGLLRDPQEAAAPRVRVAAQPRLAGPSARRALTEEEKRPLLIQREVTEIAKTQPKLMAQIIKSWLDEK